MSAAAQRLTINYRIVEQDGNLVICVGAAQLATHGSMAARSDLCALPSNEQEGTVAVTFKTTIFQAEGKNATGIRVPAESVAALGSGKRPKVSISLNGYSYRSTVAPYGDVFLLPLSAEHRSAAGLAAGDEVEVTLELDTAPRTVAVPDDLQAALTAQPGATEAFEALAFSARKEYARQVESAKASETRQRRIAAILSKLGYAA